MGDASENKPVKYRKHISIGLLAHVDAGKTTLSEAMLYKSGDIRKLGRVDKKDAFLDNNYMERERGITIFSKQARFNWKGMGITLLDTPGHVDFSAEMERTLPLLDYAVLVISGTDGVQAHTKTLWKLLRRNNIPAFLFVNKMDRTEADRYELMEELKRQLSGNIVDMTSFEPLKDSMKLMGEEELLENVAVCSEEVMNDYLETGEISRDSVTKLIRERKLFPCFFGSALKLEGIDDFLNGFDWLTECICYPSSFSARVYKIGRDEKGNRLTYLKVTGGALKVKTSLSDEKVNQIRLYSGQQYEAVQEVEAGMVCAVTGLTKTYAGQGLGDEEATYLPMLEPVLDYQMLLPDDVDSLGFYQRMQELEEEEPMLRVQYQPSFQEIHVHLMGEVQCEILKDLVQERFGVEVSFSNGNIVYKETIANAVEGVGHFEPLRHYAEVHFLMEPGIAGSGIQVETAVREEMLDRNWQRLIATHVMEKQHKGVLGGFELTDVKITLVAGRAHKKHTEGGDFRQAVYRAIRQGLMQAESVLLEPVYAFTLTVPNDKLGRAMSDIQNAAGEFEPPQTEGDFTTIKGMAPVAALQGYHTTVLSYTKGEGRLLCQVAGYMPCHNQEEVLQKVSYDPEKDIENPSSSVFCSHGAGVTVPWNEVFSQMHVDSGLMFEDRKRADNGENVQNQTALENSLVIDEEELAAIFRRTFGANRNDNKHLKKKPAAVSRAFAKSYKRPVYKDKYILVDGYNIIYAWEELRNLSESNMGGARNRLMDMMCNYQAYKCINLILVFDAYKVEGGQGEYFDYHNIHVVYTKQKQTADAYIERFTHEMGHKYDITVATSDGLEQLIVLGQGAKRLSAREFYEEVRKMEQELRDRYLDREWE